MKLIESKAEYIPQKEGLEGIYKIIELAGRTAYHSLDKITPHSAEDFVRRMIASHHGAALEAGTVYLFYSVSCYDREGQKLVSKYESNPYSKVICVGVDDNEPDEDGNYYDLVGNKSCGNEQYIITTNYRVLVENNWLDDLQYLCSPKSHEKRYTMKFICSRAIAQELTRHRTFSFLMESQRYINYSKERHGKDITYIKPYWLNCTYKDTPPESELCYLARQYPTDEAAHRFIASLVESKYAYMTLLEKGCTPQQARDVLPNATKTELIMTGFASDYRHLFDLRLFGKTGSPHPDMLYLMQKAHKVMQKAGIWDDIMSKPSKFE